MFRATSRRESLEMSDEKQKAGTQADAELEREIRAGREFTLEEAIGRMVGPGGMKGVSPVSRKEQAVAEISQPLAAFKNGRQTMVWDLPKLLRPH